MIRILKVKLKGNEGYDISPVILASALANLSSTESAMGEDRHRAMARVDSVRETFGETLAVIVDGGEQVIIANPPPQVARKLAISCRQGRPQRPNGVGPMT